MSRFININQEEIDSLLESRTSSNTKNAVAQGKKVLLEFLMLKGKKESDIENMTPSELDLVLTEFFPSLRKKNGDLMKTNSVKVIRYGIQSYLNILKGI
jgi:hypothetical protein